MRFINEKLTREEKIEELRKRFFDGKPYRYLVIENFLDYEIAKRVLSALKKEKFEHKESDLFSLSQTMDFVDVKSNVLREFYELMSCEELGRWLEKIIGIKLKIGKIDMSGSLYESCDYLLCHDDLVGERKIAFVFYLSSLEKGEGGEFVTYESADDVYVRRVGKEAKKVIPKFNSILIFEVSEKSFHSVEEVLKGKRYAIGGWWY